MSAPEAASSNLWEPDALPIRLMSHAETSTGMSVIASLAAFTGSSAVVLGVDIVAAHAEPVQCFVEVQIPNGILVYYDSQSAGEGLGVRFTYRGQVPLLAGEGMTVHTSTAGGATIDWYATAWGLLQPYDCPHV